MEAQKTEAETQDTRALLSGALDDVVRLVRLEARLIKLEAAAFFTNSRQAAALIFVASIFLLPALTLLGFALAAGVQSEFGYPAWAAYGIVGAIAFAFAASCLALAGWLMKKTTKEFFDGTGSPFTRTRNSQHHTVLAPQD